jgi:hypothetical protein
MDGKGHLECPFLENKEPENDNNNNKIIVKIL